MNIVIDLIRKGNEHHVFNFETIKVLAELELESVFYLDKDSSAIEVVKKNQCLNKVSVKKNKFYFWILSSVFLLKIFYLYRKAEGKFILLSATPLQYYICTLVSRFYRLDIIVFMHGELGYISCQQGIGQRLGKFFISRSFNTVSSVKFVALSEYIYRKLSDVYRKANFTFIEHPLQEIDRMRKGCNNNPTLTIGSFGVHSKEKNSDEIYTLAKLLSMQMHFNLNIMTIGVSNGTFEFDKHPNVKHVCRGFLNQSLTPKEEFMAQVQHLDFALFFNGADHKYDLVPSGVFADCIALELPIISLTNPKVEYFFQTYGDVGILCKDINDMAIQVEKLLSSSSEKTNFINTIKNIKQKFTCEAYRNDLYRALYAKN